MKINTIKNLLLLFVFAALMLTSCSGDDGGDVVMDDEEMGAAGTLEGVWTSGTATINSITIDGQDLDDWLEDLRQELIEGGLSEEDINDILMQNTDAFTEGYEDLDGTLTFNSDGTYEINDSEGSDTGTWELTNEDQTLILDQSTADELAMDIVSLTASRFEGLVEEELGLSNDEEGSNSIVAISATFVFER